MESGIAPPIDLPRIRQSEASHHLQTSIAMPLIHQMAWQLTLVVTFFSSTGLLNCVVRCRPW